MGNERLLAGPVCALVFTAVLAGKAAGAERDPLSAIEWLSDSVDLPESVADPGGAAQQATLPDAITVAPLDAPVPDRAGTMSARALGLDPGLWGRSAAPDLARAINGLPDARTAPPSLRSFLHDLMVVRLDPPIDASEDDSLYLARLDLLLQLARLDAAERLIEAAGAHEPRRFRRAFDIALLTGAETEACKVIEETPQISPTYPARVFCLARGGLWDVAAITLGNAEALDILTPEEDQLLLHFLDPELFEGEPLPPPPRMPTPLTFRLYEAVGERLPTEQLPLAFAVADLGDTVGWKSRLRAVERRAAVDAVSFERLLSIYTERAPAASGGIWERVAAVQDLLRAVEAGAPDELAGTLPTAWAFADEANYQASLAKWIVEELEGLDLAGQAGHVAFEIALLAGRPDIASGFSAGTPEDRFLLAVAEGRGADVPRADPLGRAVMRGLFATGPGQHYEALIDDGRAGEALLSALAVLMDGAAGNPDRAAHALALLRELGLDDLARQAAVELLLEEGAA